ncbi:MAG: sialate O-acetylesterase [Muribaculum sp.]|nr:sialate O-acetylesterase [Muribaculum sp.]
MKKIFQNALMSCAVAIAAQSYGATDPNFHIYLCIGQSNMEGNAPIEPQDRVSVPDRFKVMSTVNFKNPPRNLSEWYTAVPPLVRENTGLTPMDYFGRTMVDNLPEYVTVGVVPVAVGGCKIEHLDKDFDPASIVNEAGWFQGFMSNYDNHPYSRLIQCAKEAQKQGVIKGILLHQGESNTNDRQWPDKVKKVYEDILSDLNLNAEEVPLLAGEVVTSSEGGVCGSMNAIIDALPQTIPTAHVVSAGGLPQKGDGLHFTAHAYRVLGCRYAVEMLATMGITDPVVEYSEDEPFVHNPDPTEGDFVFDLNSFNPSIWESGSFNSSDSTFVAGQYGFGGWQYDKPIDLSGYKYIVAVLSEPETNGAEFKVFDTQSYWEMPYAAKFNGGTIIVAELDGMMKNLDTGIVPLNTKQIYRVGFWAYGGQPIKIKHVYATNTDPYNLISNVIDDIKQSSVFDLTGRRVGTSQEMSLLTPGIYISKGRKMIVAQK